MTAGKTGGDARPSGFGLLTPARDRDILILTIMDIRDEPVLDFKQK